jgi:hypothetical protein
LVQGGEAIAFATPDFEMPLPFSIHRRIPFIRRPFYQRDMALAERNAARMERDRALAERDAARQEQSTQECRATHEGYNGCIHWSGEGSAAVKQPANHLRTFFDNRKVGAGIWKWLHYFEIYERHFSRFRGQEVHIAEIGIYSGGSLEMWRDYFGPRAYIYGVDIEPRCKVYEHDRVKVFIGDQADKSFWREFRTRVPKLDIVIDDGGHEYEQQLTSLEELLPHLRPGGVYLCEDVHGAFNRFASYVGGLAHKLNEPTNNRESIDDPERRIVGYNHVSETYKLDSFILFCRSR